MKYYKNQQVCRNSYSWIL